MDSSINNFNPWATAGAVGLGSLGLLKSFNNDKPQFNNPADAARPFLDKIPSTLSPYFTPYIDQGNAVNPILKNQYNSMTANPGNFLTSLSQGYKESPGYQFKLHQALSAANNAAAAGGMLGSPAHQFENEQIGEGLASQDYDTWLNHILNLFGSGQRGLEGVSERGFGASKTFGEHLAQALTGQGELAGYGAAEQNRANQAEAKANSDQSGDFLAMAAKLIPYIFGG